jgi:very-short-patch-repair endonuclease
MAATYPLDPIHPDHQSPAERWRDEWAERARGVAIPHRGFVLTHEDAPLSQAQIRSLVRQRIWSAPRRGVLGLVHPAGDAQVAAALNATAAVLGRTDSMVSHESAATLYGLAVLRRASVPAITGWGRNGTRAGTRMYRSTMRPTEAADWYRTPLTSVARTVSDIARTSRWAGLVTGDAAVREGLTSVAELHAAADACAGWPGSRAARFVAEHVNGLSESVLESLTRACLVDGGLPIPALQVWIPEAGARVDMLYPTERLVIEADGMLKYTDLSALHDEKRRQERIERAGYRVLRVLWADVVGQPVATAERISAALRLERRK